MSKPKRKATLKKPTPPLATPLKALAQTPPSAPPQVEAPGAKTKTTNLEISEPTAVVNAVDSISVVLRRGFAEGITRPLGWRKRQLRGLMQMVARHEAQWFAALKSDLGRPDLESRAADTGFVRMEARHALRNLATWARPRRLDLPWQVWPAHAQQVPEPLGVVLILAPWNYPLQLALAPLIGAIAAGNAAVIKPSEMAPATGTLLAELLPRYLDPRAYAVVTGGPEVGQGLLEQRWDHILYTGGAAVGKKVMAAAAEHLTPVTLELGGKSPAVVLSDAHVRHAAERIAWGKFFNAGQTCIAPDYVLVERAVSPQLLAELRRVLTQYYGEDPQASPHFGRIVNDRHHQRLSGYLTEGTVALGGQTQAEKRYIAPTLLTQVPPDAAVMREEIFGPILPILEVDNLAEALDFINGREKPLALYVFTRDNRKAEQVVAHTSSGGVCVNNVMYHAGAPGVSLGGVGASGMGAYRGENGFLTFSHLKPVMRKSFEIPLLHPPHGWFKRLVAWLFVR